MDFQLAQPEISIIIPVYNAERYLNKCINSILNQNFRNFELILVNDGSLDNSGNICEYYSQKDSRIKVFHQDNQGVSKARNLGLKYATGNYIHFIDSDDWIEKNFFSTYFNNLEKDVDIVFVGCKIENKDCTITINLQDYIYNKKEIAIPQLYQKGLLGVTWNKLFKNKIIQTYNIRFNPQLNSFEDELFTLEYCRFINKIQTLSYTGYHYMMYNNTSSLSKRILSIEENLLIASMLQKVGLEISNEELYQEYINENYTLHLHNSLIEHVYEKKNPIKISTNNKKDYIKLAYKLFNKYKYCKMILGSKRSIMLRFVFLINNYYWNNLLFKLYILILKAYKIILL